MKTVYFKFIQLPEEVRNSNKIKSKGRLDCILQFNESNYKGLDCFMNKKGQLVLFKTPCSSIVVGNYKRRAEFLLTNNSLNLSSIYLEDLDFPLIGYGYPNSKKTLSNGNLNPQFQFKNDGYLFLINKEISELELIVFHEGRNHINSLYQKFIDGDFDEEIERMRKLAKPFFHYIGLSL